MSFESNAAKAEEARSFKADTRKEAEQIIASGGEATAQDLQKAAEQRRFEEASRKEADDILADLAREQIKKVG